MELLIKHNGEFEHLDIQGDAGLIMTANNPFEFQFGRAFKTYTIQILNTGRNNFLLGNLFHKNLGQKIKFQDVYIKLQGIYVKCILNISNINSQYAEGIAISTSGLFWDELRYKNLKHDFSWLSLQHVLNATNVQIETLAGGDLVYDFVFRGQGVSSGDFMRIVDIAEMQPAVRLQALMQRMFSGYTVEQNVWSSAEYESLYLLFCQPFSRNTPDWLENAAVFGQNEASHVSLATLEQDLSTNTVWFADWIQEIDGEMTLNADKTYRYEVPETGAYKVTARLTASFEVSNTDDNPYSFINRHYLVRVRELNADFSPNRVLYSQRIDLANDTYIIFNDVRTFNIDTKTVSIEAGKVLEIEIYYRHSVDSGSVDQIASVSSAAFDFVRVTPWQWFGQGDTVPGDYAIPDLTVQDFLSGLFRQFNIEFYFNEERKKVVLQSRSQAAKQVFDLTPLILNASQSMQTLRILITFCFPIWKIRKTDKRSITNALVVA
jgi:hypothetical protein